MRLLLLALGVALGGCAKSSVASVTQAASGATDSSSTLPAPAIIVIGELRHSSMRSASRVALAPSGDIVVSDPLGRAVHVFSPGGILKRTLKGGLRRPLGCAVDKDGRIYVGDHGTGSVLVFRKDGARIGPLGGKTRILLMPSELAYDPGHDELFVMDSKANQVFVYNTDGRRLRTIGQPGTNPGQLSFPSGLAYDNDKERIFVADHNNTRIQVFDRQGTWLSSFGSFGSEAGQFSRPQGLALDSKKRLYVAEVYQGRLQVLDERGHHISYVGSYGRGKGELALPSDAVVDGYDRLFVTSFRTAKVVIYGIDKVTALARGGAAWGQGVVIAGSAVSLGQWARSEDAAMQDDAEAKDARSASLEAGRRQASFAARRREAGAQAPDTSALGKGPDKIDGGSSVRDQGPKGTDQSGESDKRTATSASSGGRGCAVGPKLPTSGFGPFGLLVLCLLLQRGRRRGGKRARGRRCCVFLGLLFALGAVPTTAQAQTLAAPHDSSNLPKGCAECHSVHGLYFGRFLDPQYGESVENLCMSCHFPTGPAPAVQTHGCDPLADPQCDNAFSINCVVCHNPHKQEQNDINGSTYGKLLRATIATPNTGEKTVVLLGASGSKSFADGDTTYDGVCEVCHTKTKYHRHDGSVGSAHFPGRRCTLCHRHTASFKPGAPTGSHAIHLDAADPRGPGVDCSVCHGGYDAPLFADGKNLTQTAVCDPCHSPGGSYNGVVSTNGSVGAKDVWTNVGGASGVYDGFFLRPGLEKWCAGCHDEAPSVIKGVSAPNVIGDEDGGYLYGRGWGFYKTGHGLPSGLYPISGAAAARLECGDCHDNAAPHIDGEPRTYSFASDNYQAGYRLASVDGKPPLVIRRDMSSGAPVPKSDFALCFRCHEDYDIRTLSMSADPRPKTNFWNTGSTWGHEDDNLHAYHTAAGPDFATRWDSDWDGTNDSPMTCPSCHNVHGSPNMRMTRHGELISTPGTSDRVPWVDMHYVDTTGTYGDYPTLMQSTAGKTRRTDAPYGCGVCHGTTLTWTRDPRDVHAPAIAAAYGRPGGDRVHLVFGEEVYTETGQPASPTGDLVAADLALANLSQIISAVSHTAGDSRATLTLSGVLSADDIGTGTVAAASESAIYDAYDNGMATTPVVITGDTTVPVASDLSPDNGASGVSQRSLLSLTLADTGSGVDLSSFSLRLTGSGGYNQTYTGLDADVVYVRGAPNQYELLIRPDVAFGDNERITATLVTTDFVGNALVAPSWQFTTRGPVNHPPQLEWTRELMAYTIDGVKPSHGEEGTDFTFRVKYKDADNQAPGGAVLLRLGGTSYPMSAADGSTDYEGGKIYTLTLTLSTPGTFDYSFSATDGIDAAEGEATASTPVEVIASANVRNVPSVQYPTITDAMTNWTAGDTILVAPGDYSGQVYIHDPEVVLRSHDDPENTRLFNPDTASTTKLIWVDIWYISSGTHAVTIDGFTIDGEEPQATGVRRGIECNNADLTLENCIVRDNGREGVYFNGGYDAVVRNTVFTGNSALRGGAMMVVDVMATLAVSDSVFSYNTAFATETVGAQGGAIFLNMYVPATFTRTRFDHNVATSTTTKGAAGGAIYANVSAVATFSDCSFTGNSALANDTGQGGALYLNNDATVAISRSLISGNSAYNGAVMSLNGASATLENSIIVENSAVNFGGGFYLFAISADVLLANCTLVGNTAGNRGGGLWLENFYGNASTITNSILWGNTPEAIGSSFAPAPVVSYSDIDQPDYLFGSEGSFFAEPLFVDEAAGDYHLQWRSPCIDTGGSSGAPSDDLEGNARPSGDGVDVGAYEYIAP